MKDNTKVLKSSVVASAWTSLKSGRELASLLASVVVAWWAVRLFTRGPSFVSENVPLALLGVSLVVLVAWARRLPTLAWAWWAAGLLTLSWSQAPGHTLLLALWELVFLAGLVIGRSAFGAPIVVGALLVNGLLVNLTTAALTPSGAATFLSGSNLYVAGALALAAFPIAFVTWAKGGRWWLLGAVGAVLSLYAVGISGARAVYVPGVLVALILFWRTWRDGVAWTRLALMTGVLAVGIVGLDLVAPHAPLRTATIGKLVQTVTTTTDFAAGGNFQTRLQMWEAGAHIAARFPQGLGNGAFASVFQAYLEWPVYFSNFLHNYFLETLVTGGWLRLVTLLLLLGVVAWRGWRSEAWPWVAAAVGLWGTLAFDITGAMPPVMLAAFVVLGAALPRAASEAQNVERSQKTARAWVSLAGVAVAVVASAWWFWPCGDGLCLIRHRLAWSGALGSALRLTPPSEQPKILADVRERYGRSLAVAFFEASRATSDAERTRLLEGIVRAFPYGSLTAYSELAAAYEREGRKRQAADMLRLGVQRFSRERSPAGLRLALAPPTLGALDLLKKERARLCREVTCDAP